MITQDPDASCPLPLSTRTPLLCTALGQGSQQDWDWVWERYLAASNANQVSRYYIQHNTTIQQTILCEPGISTAMGWMR